MGKVELFTINFDKSNTIYAPGETLSGSLLVRASDRLKINLIKIRLYGAASTKW
jgi:hypothetical protein